MSENEVAVIFVGADRRGREVVLHEDTWYEHILGNHPEMMGSESAVADAIQGAEHVKIDRFAANRRCYYRRGLLHAPYHHDYLKVVVAFYPPDAEGVVRGNVVSAYPAPTIHRREANE